MYPTLVLNTPSVRSYSYCGPQNHPVEKIAISVEGGDGGDGGDGGGEAMAAVWENCILDVDAEISSTISNPLRPPKTERPINHITALLRIEVQNGRAVLITSSDATGMHSNPFHLRTPRALPHDGSIRRRPAKSWPCPPIQPSNISNATTDTPLARVLGSCGHNAFNTWRQHAARSFRRTRRTLQ